MYLPRLSATIGPASMACCLALGACHDSAQSPPTAFQTNPQGRSNNKTSESTPKRAQEDSDALGDKDRPAATADIAKPRAEEKRNSLEQQGFVDIRRLIPNAVIDMRYAGKRNFVGSPVYPSNASCYLQKPAAIALKAVQKELDKKSLRLLIWDCYRPFSVQEKFWSLVPDSRYVAEPSRQQGSPFRGSKHNRGAAIDLSLASQKAVPLLMPTDHDDFSPKAHRDAKELPAKAIANRELLRQAMEAQGFQGIATEWWHYDFPAQTPYPLSDFPFP